MILAFDMDDTIVRTREANLLAYREVGVEPPENHWCAPWRDWCSEKDHELKQLVFPAMLRRHGALLPAGVLLQRAGGVVLTLASPATVRAVRACFPSLCMASEWSTFASREDKVEWLRCRQPGTYFDDQAAVVRAVREETRWQAVDVSGL